MATKEKQEKTEKAEKADMDKKAAATKK